MRLTERITVYPSCDKQGNLIKRDCIKIENKGLAEEKLCQLEDMEEELGIDLITLFKAFSEGVYVVTADLKVIFIKPDLVSKIDVRNKKIVFDEEKVLVSEDFKDYGKTWSLVKEELE